MFSYLHSHSLPLKKYLSLVVFHKTKVMQIWIAMKLSKWWQNLDRFSNFIMGQNLCSGVFWIVSSACIVLVASMLFTDVTLWPHNFLTDGHLTCVFQWSRSSSTSGTCTGMKCSEGSCSSTYPSSCVRNTKQETSESQGSSTTLGSTSFLPWTRMDMRWQPDRYTSLSN